MAHQIPPQLLVEFAPGIASEPCSEAEHQRAHRRIKRAVDILNNAKNAFVSYARCQENWEYNGGNPRVKARHCDRDGTNEDTTDFWIYLLDPTRIITTAQPTGYDADASNLTTYLPGGDPNVTQYSVIGYRQGLSQDGTEDVMVCVSDVMDAPIMTTTGYVGDDYRNYKPGWALMDGEENHPDNGGTGYNKMGDWVSSGKKATFESAGTGSTDDGAFTKAGVPDGVEYGDPEHDHAQNTEHPHIHQIATYATTSKELVIVDGTTTEASSWTMDGKINDGDCTTGPQEDGNCGNDITLSHNNTETTSAEPKHLYEWPMERLNNSMEGIANQATDEDTSTMDAGSNDAFWVTGTTDPDDAQDYLVAGALAGGAYNIWLRFTGVNIPQGSTINWARLRVEALSTIVTTGTVNLKISAIDADAVGTGDIDTWTECDNATLTTAQVDWDIAAPGLTADGQYVSPDISSVIQEMLDRGTTPFTIVIMIKDDGTAGASDRVSLKSYDEGTFHPRLEMGWH